MVGLAVAVCGVAIQAAVAPTARAASSAVGVDTTAVGALSIGADRPAPNPSTIAACHEIIPTMARQMRDPSHLVRREPPGRSWSLETPAAGLASPA